MKIRGSSFAKKGKKKKKKFPRVVSEVEIGELRELV